MGNSGRWVVFLGLATSVTGGMLYGASLLVGRGDFGASRDSLVPSKLDVDSGRGRAASRARKIRLDQLVPKPGVPKAAREISSSHVAAAIARDSSDETQHYLVAKKAAPRNVPVKKWLPDLPFRAYQQDPRGMQDPQQAIVPDWVREDWVNRYRGEK